MILENTNYNLPTDSYERKSQEAAERRRLNPYSGLGKLPPQAVELEEIVLGALMLQKDAILDISGILNAASFYKDNHQKIFSAIMDLHVESHPVDILTVVAKLRSKGELEMVGGAFYITELTNRVASSANIGYHAKIIEQKFMQREVIRISTDSINDAYEDTTDVFDLLDTMQSTLHGLNSNRHGRDIKHIKEIVERRQKDYHIVPIDGLTGVGSGLKDLDAITAGWQRSDLIICAARPAMGKTAFALNIAKNAAILHGVPTAIFELEMNDDQVTDRLISSETNIYQDTILKRRLSELDHTEMERKLVKLKEAEIYIDDTPGLTLMQFRSKLIRLKQLHNIGFAVIDYLQLMQGAANSKSNREQDLSTISRGLKTIAKELNIPILALSQLSRAVESRPSKIPMLSDLRESGAIEQDADMVMFLMRPEYYGMTEWNGSSSRGLCLAIIAKNRQGINDTVPLDFHGGFMVFRDWDKAAAPLLPPTPQSALEFTIQPADEGEDLPF